MHLISPPDKKLLSSTSRGSCICSVARGRRRFVRGVCRPRFICFRAGLFLDRRRRTGARVPFIHPSIHLPDVCCSFHARSRLRTNEARAGANKIKAAASCDAVHQSQTAATSTISWYCATVQFAAVPRGFPDPPFTCGECDQLVFECTERLRSITTCALISVDSHRSHRRYAL
jgi:hypothetical protein